MNQERKPSPQSLRYVVSILHDRMALFYRATSCTHGTGTNSTWSLLVPYGTGLISCIGQLLVICQLGTWDHLQVSQ